MKNLSSLTIVYCDEISLHEKPISFLVAHAYSEDRYIGQEELIEFFHENLAKEFQQFDFPYLSTRENLSRLAFRLGEELGKGTVYLISFNELNRVIEKSAHLDELREQIPGHASEMRNPNASRRRKGFFGKILGES